MSDLIVLAVIGGERSQREWGGMLQAAGFRLSDVHAVGNDIGIVEAKPV